MLTQSEKATTFAELHKRAGTFIIPNPWDVGSARLLAHLGFEALATSSAGYAFTLGIADHAVGREQYLRYVPIRLPWTICVQDRIPPGSAGVLVNQTHQFPDLYVVMNAQEKQMFEAIDGRRSVSEIVDGIEGAGVDPRTFFEKLWWYDQVVFDTSKA